MSARGNKSVMWEHFERMDSAIAKCNICKELVSYKTSISNLKKHLSRRHPTVTISTTKLFSSADSSSSGLSSVSQREISPTIMEGTEMSPPAALLEPGPSNPKGKVQSRLHPFTIKKMSEKERKKIDEDFMKLFTRDYQPFSIVEDEGFTAFVKSLNPSYNLPSRKKISRTLVPARYEEAKLKLASILKDDKIRSVCLTTDCWTSSTNESYLAVMVHFVCEGKLVSPTLECCATEGAKTSENLAKDIKEIVDFWGISDKIIFAVSDNASNIVNAIRNILKYKHMGCAAHKIHLIVEKALDTTKSAEEVLEKVKKISKHFRCSTKSWQILRECQKKEGVEVPKKLLISMPTRWNSTYNMVKRFSELELHIRTATARLNVDLPSLTASEWKLVREIGDILKPFLDVTECLSSKKFPSASSLITIINGLNDVLQRMSCDEEFSEFSAGSKELIRVLISELNKKERFGYNEKSGTLSKCSFLDPRFKTFGFKNESTADQTKQEVENLLISRMKAGEPEQSTSEPTKEVEKTSIWHSLLETKKAKAQPIRGVEAKAIIELDNYIDQEILNIDQDPLQWWFQNRNKFPHLYQIAEELLCVVSSSVPCEQLFSKAGMLLSVRRCQLSPEKARMLIFLNSNEKLLQDF